MIEYRVTFLAFTPHEATAQMNAMAAEGWYFVSTIGKRGGMGVIMERGMRHSEARVAPICVEGGSRIIMADGSVMQVSRP